jgi:hypothetical protein
MTRMKRGDEASAQEAFREALRCREPIRRDFLDRDFGEFWHQWLITEAVRREAEQVLGID